MLWMVIKFIFKYKIMILNFKIRLYKLKLFYYKYFNDLLKTNDITIEQYYLVKMYTVTYHNYKLFKVVSELNTLLLKKYDK